MPIDARRYPANWPEISREIRFNRANNRCEWCNAENHKPHPVTGSYVILTVAHLGVEKPDGSPGDKEDKMDCRPENLAALCQRCHLNYDRPENVAAAIRTKLAKVAADREKSGQLQLL